MLQVRAWNIQVTTTDVVYGLVFNQESAVGVLNRAMYGQDGVVG
jgi:hypothetical protein